MKKGARHRVYGVKEVDQDRLTAVSRFATELFGDHTSYQ